MTAEGVFANAKVHREAEAGTVIYADGDVGEHMWFSSPSCGLPSPRITVSTLVVVVNNAMTTASARRTSADGSPWRRPRASNADQPNVWAIHRRHAGQTPTRRRGPGLDCASPLIHCAVPTAGHRRQRRPHTNPWSPTRDRLARGGGSASWYPEGRPQSRLADQRARLAPPTTRGVRAPTRRRVA